MNELFVTMGTAGLKSMVIILGVLVLVLIIVAYCLNKQIGKMMNEHEKELAKKDKKYDDMLDEKASTVRELLAQKRELEEKCKNYKAQRDFLMEGKKNKEAESTDGTAEN